MKKAITERMALRLEPVRARVPAKMAGPRMPATFLEDGEEGKELRRSLAWNHAGEQRTRQGLAAALHHADQHRQDDEVRRRLHVVAQHADAGVYRQAQENAALGADARRQTPEQEGEGDADELHQQNGADEDALLDAELGAVDGRHATDGADAVVVDQEGHQQQERLRVSAQVPAA